MCVRNIRFLPCLLEGSGEKLYLLDRSGICLFTVAMPLSHSCRQSLQSHKACDVPNGLLQRACHPCSHFLGESVVPESRKYFLYQGTGDTWTRQLPVHGKTIVCSATFSQLSSELTALHRVVKHETTLFLSFFWLFYLGSHCISWVDWVNELLSQPPEY